MARRPLRDVWAVPCPKCQVGANEGCRDLRSQTGRLYGRRTHRERAQRIRETPMATIEVPTARLWDSWMGNTYTTITTGSTLGTSIWNTWTATTSTTLNYDPDGLWRRWDGLNQAYVRATAEEELAIQRRADQAQQRRERASARRLAEMEHWHGAEERALTLFKSLLTAEQLAQWEAALSVDVRGSSGGLYRIEGHRDTVHGNIVAIDEHGCQLGRLCVAPRMNDGLLAMPIGDGYVGQLLALRFNEPLLLVHANWSGQRRCQQPALAA